MTPRKSRALVAMTILFLVLAAPQTGFAGLFSSSNDKTDPGEIAEEMLEKGDGLGFRAYLRKLVAKHEIKGDSYHKIKGLLLRYPDQVGFDLVYLWNSASTGKPSELDQQLDAADQLMLDRRFSEAFSKFQAALVKLKAMTEKESNPERKLEETSLYPFVVQSMARALYGAGRYRDAYVTYGWLDPRYPRFRQVLFERMWAAFRVGRIDLALGSIASQHSSYFSQFLPSESYLIQSYIYRKLCRTDEMKLLVRTMKTYQADIEKGDLASWAKTDLEQLVLWHLMHSPLNGPTRYVSAAERKVERDQIRGSMLRDFQRDRPTILRNLQTAMAYAELADVSSDSVVLQPVRRLPSRAAYLNMNLEIWPADSREEWADEMGFHLFFGESHCLARASSSH